MSSVVVRPPIPYHGPIAGGLHEDKRIEIRGSAPYGAETFSVSIVSGHNVKADRPLHLSVRFRNRVVGRNAMQRNSWGSEEKKGDLFPFIQGKEFTISIIVNSVCYFISVNGRHCWKFVHRLPMLLDSALLIEGHVNIERIDFIGNNPNPHVYPGTEAYPTSKVYPASQAYPTPQVCPGSQAYPTPQVYPGSQAYPTPQVYPGSQAYPTSQVYPQVCPIPSVYPAPQISSGYVVAGELPNPTFVSQSHIIAPPEQNPYSYPTGDFLQMQTVHNPKIPFSLPIPGGVRPGMMIYIIGRPKQVVANDFIINLQNSTASYPPPDIAFHFNPCFHNRTVVRNTRVNGVWEWEEADTSYFPFHPGREFHIQILVEYDKYMVAVDNKHLLEFRHRLQPMEQFAAALHIEHDVHISSIRFA